MALLKCSRCGKVMSYQPADTAGRVKCSACGAVLRVPVSTPTAAPAVDPPRPAPSAAGPQRVPPRPIAARHPWKWVAVGGLCATAALLVVLMALIVHLSQGRSEQRYLEEHRERLLALKAEAESLALAGKLVESHAKYREMEQLVGGRIAKDPAFWELLERAKHDQDSVYRALIEAQTASAAGRAPAQASKAGNESRPPAQYAGFERAEPVASAAATRPVRATPPATAPQAAPVVQKSPVRLPPTAVVEPVPENKRAATPATQPVARPQAAVAQSPKPVGSPRRKLSASEAEDARIGQAIQKGVDFLIKQFEADQIRVEGMRDDTYKEGLNALCVYALLNASQAIQDERLDIRGLFMRRLVERMKEHPYLIEANNRDAPVTYAHALRACALAVYNRAEDRDLLEQDVRWLVLASMNGAYTYNDEEGKVYGGGSPFIGPEDGTTLYYAEPEKPKPLHNGEIPYPRPPVPINPGPPIITGKLPKGYTVGNYPLGDAYRNRIYTEAPNARWDNSNTQYGVLGVWAGAEVGVEVPIDYWTAVEEHWASCQLPTGEWYYNPDPRPHIDPSRPRHNEPTFAMTVAGIASLFVTHDYLDAPAFGEDVGRRPFSPPLARGLQWLERADLSNEIIKNAQYLGYNLFGLERVGLASGFKYFGNHDWYHELAAKALAVQKPDGSWCRDADGERDEETEVRADALIDTAYVLLFLSRGRHPILMNKLRFDGSWCNRPRDIANLTKFAGRELERQLNWQVVGFQREWHDWMDAPVLYIASHQAPKFSNEQLQQLRSFSEAGGLIFTHADGGSSQFNAFVIQLVKKLFPEYEMANLPANHELYSLQYQLADKPPLKVVSNGSRILMVHSPQDLSTAWQVRNGTKRANWELAMNLFIYAAGKGDLRNRLSSPYIPPVSGRASKVLSLARLKYAGHWNPEPHAWERFSRYLRQETEWGLDLKTVELRDLKPAAHPIAHLTGNVSYTATDAEVEALRNYVEAGGVVLVDACGGSPEFAQSAVTLLNRAFPGKKLTPMEGAHRLFSSVAPGMDDLSQPLVRPYASGKSATRVEVLSSGKGKVLFSALDLTTGLLGTNTWSIVGYQPEYAQMLAKNIVLWTAEGARE